jgi:glucose-1-phosphate thymidylyltransferase
VIDNLKPSARGEFEITDLLNHYLRQSSLVHTVFEGEWHDAGTIDSLLEANEFAATFVGELPVISSQDLGDEPAASATAGSRG